VIASAVLSCHPEPCGKPCPEGYRCDLTLLKCVLTGELATVLIGALTNRPLFQCLSLDTFWQVWEYQIISSALVRLGPIGAG
jgi:hypothetical protein